VTDSFDIDAADLANDARRLLAELDRDVPGASASTGECKPPLDVLETADSVEVVVDLPGVPREALRVAIRRKTLLVVGAKLSPVAEPAPRFHIAERSYGRFARAVHIGGAVDSSRARAIVASGQLRVILPRIPDRRGQFVQIPISAA
jgi:HSP20 family protein